MEMEIISLVDFYDFLPFLEIYTHSIQSTPIPSIKKTNSPQMVSHLRVWVLQRSLILILLLVGLELAMTTGNSFDEFPVGLRVLVVDDDVICLNILDQMLRRCSYHVTTCSEATAALDMLRERKGGFDVVLSDVHMPHIDGFKLLQLVALEMDLPVIMMSADGRPNIVLRGIKNGAYDYMIKPIRQEQLKNIWQLVVRKKWNQSKQHENSGDKDHRHKPSRDNVSSVHDGGDGIMTSHRKKRKAKEDDDGEPETDEPGRPKKARVVWSVELHKQFVSAVNQLGIDKAVPKRILELMNVPGLTRENVASHLQKYRLYLKRLSGVAQGGGPNSFCGSMEHNPIYGRYEIQASGQLPPQTLAAELLGQPTANVCMPVTDHQPSKCVPMDHVMPYSQNVISKPAFEDINPAWHSNSMVGSYGQLGGQTGHNMLFAMLQSQSQQRQSITVQPSRLVVPNQSSGVSVNQTTSFNKSSIIDDGVGQRSEGEMKMAGCQVDAGSRIDGVAQTESPTNLNHNGGRRIQQEPNIEYLPRHASQNDLMSVFSE